MDDWTSRTQRALGSPARNLVWIVLFVATVAAVSTGLYMAAGWSFVDASYMVLLTIYTVGYTEVRPIDTGYLHAVTIGTMMLGCTGMILLTGVLVQFFTALQIEAFIGNNRMNNRIAHLSGHVIVCGYGRIGMTVAGDLARAGRALVVVEREPHRLAEAEAAGHCTLAGDATEEEVLLAAGIARAATLATVLPDDAANVFISLSARNLNTGIEIIARGEAPTTERKLIHAGADHVVFPTHIGAEKIARMILFPASDGITGDARLRELRGELEELGLEIEPIRVEPGSVLAGLSVAEAESRSEGAAFVVQIDRADGRSIPRPAPDERISAGDCVLIVARDPASAAKTLAARRRPVKVGRTLFREAGEQR